MTIPPSFLMRLRPALSVALCAAILALTGCGHDTFAPGVPTRIRLSESAFAFTALGQNHKFSASVIDGNGDPVTTSLIWSTSDPTVLKLNGDGLATAAAVGSATVRVSAGGLGATIAVVVGQTPARIRAIRGDGQSGPASQPLPSQLVVEVSDALNHVIAGVTVTFAPGVSGGTVDPATATTDNQGRAATTFTLGATDGSYSATATVTGTALAASFGVQTGISFDIELVFLSSATQSQAQAFGDAESRWETIIRGDLPDDYAFLPANSCGASPALDRPIDDLLIFVTLADIDGPGGIIGQAGPCFLHEVGFLPAIGQMTFDVADLDVIEGLGLLPAVITHEMGHVLGYGTVWNDRGLLADPSLFGGIDPYFTGPEAIAAFDAAGGTTYLGAKVPVENQGGPGTADGHWRESVFNAELMTGFVNQGFNPLSAVSIASMADIGYTVDLTPADPFTLTAPPPGAAPGVGVHLINDILAGPIGTINRTGKARLFRR